MKFPLFLRFFLIYCFLACTIPLLHAQDLPIVLSTPTGDLQGSLMMPENRLPAPVVLLISDAGPCDRDGNQPNLKNNCLKLLAESLRRNGIASVRYDKRAVGNSTSAIPSKGRLLFSHYVEDARGWVDKLSGDKRFSKIILAGHGEGALIGMLASVNNKAVNGYISIAGLGEPADVYFREQLRSHSQEYQEGCAKIIEKLKSGDTLQKVAPHFKPLFREEVQPYLISWFRHNPQQEIAKLKIPVLLILGTMDAQVKFKDLDLLANACPNAKKELIPDMNHVLKSISTIEKMAQTATLNNPDLPVVPQIIQSIIFFTQHLN
ncbi:MAG: alpha/beta hydrolase [Marinilabiliales bacterium]|nr:alpha/beta hydrolase [Marinilabiliales bacterium]